MLENSTIHTIEVDPVAESMELIQDFINKELDSYSDCIKPLTQISVAVDELVSNIIQYSDSKEKIVVRLSLQNDTATIEFIDKGIPFNPLEQGEPDITMSVEERGIGGLGIFIVKKTMDSVEYQRENDSNHLTISKNLM